MNREGLTAEERAQLAAGHHDVVARGLRDRGRPDLAAEILEDIWDFDNATEARLEANQPLAAVRGALEAERPELLDRVVQRIVDMGDPEVIMEAAEILRDRGRHADAARLLEQGGAGPDTRASVLADAGDELAAARAWSEAGEPQRALAVLEDSGREDAERYALAARLHWDLGDAQAVARSAQVALRLGADDPDVRALLARALVALGHDIAAQLVAPADVSLEGAPLPGRYRVTAPLSATLAGAAYEGVDRVTMEEVEVHLLLAEHPGHLDDPALREAVDAFGDVALRAAAVGHPAIRPILALDRDAGLLVLPRAEGPSLRQLIRAPGMAAPRARSMIAFLLEGLAQASDRGLAHGNIAPSQLVCDRLGRPTLGPFGTHALRGLVATRTGSLRELVTTTAPELRKGEPPTLAGDIHALGKLWGALVGGSLHATTGPGPDGDLMRQMTDPDPTARPDARWLLQQLRRPVADATELHRDTTQSGTTGEGDTESGSLVAGLRVVVADSWSEDALIHLCAARDPWLQPILDRSDRVVVLAPWPPDSRGLPASTPGWRELVPEAALANLDDTARQAVEERLRPSSLVATPGGEWMIALDDLLSR